MTNVKRVQDLPLGTRFRYLDGSDVWVLLERHGNGLIAKWEGAGGSKALQSIFSIAETAEECEALLVEVVDK